MMAAMQYQHACSLSKLLAGIFEVQPETDREINGLCLDSRKLQPGDLFIACAGGQVHGIQFAEQVIAAGAAAIIWEPEAGADAIPLSWRATPDGGQLPLLAIPELSQQVGVIADRYYGQPSQQLFVTGITGTNGKTSVSQFLAEVLVQDDKCGVIGTLGTGLYGALEKPTHTTPDAVRVHELMQAMLKDGAKHAVMEVSSHALDQGRVNGVHFDCAVFTNLSRDHLDYHGDMASYGAAKQRLFHFPGLRYAVINLDDEFGRQLQNDLSAETRLLTYGLNNSDVVPDLFASNIELSSEGIRCHITSPWGEGELNVPVIGRFNISNLLAVLAVLLLQEMPLSVALQRLAGVGNVAGRMECLREGAQPLVVIDYAHTPDALEQVLVALKEHCAGQLYCVFGCGGDRDQGKRPLMGEVAARLADQIILTNDNPRTESPEVILAQIEQGIAAKEKLTIEAERDKAINMAITQASEQDIVLVAGKGHEDYQEVNGERKPFSDHLVAAKAMGVSV